MQVTMINPKRNGVEWRTLKVGELFHFKYDNENRLYVKVEYNENKCNSIRLDTGKQEEASFDYDHVVNRINELNYSI